MERLQPLADGVWRLALRTPTLLPATSTNLMIAGRSKLALIEPATPFDDERQVVDQALEALRAEGREVAMLLVTHHHIDHIGDVERLREGLGVPLLAHPQTAERLPFEVDREVVDGEELDLGEGTILRAVHTPGHAPGHLVFHELSSGIAHAGDMVAGEGTILVDPSDAGDMKQYLDSLHRLGGLGTSALIPAHGPVLTDPRGVVDHYVEHRLGREAKVLAAIDAGASTDDEVLAGAYADTPKMLWPLAARALEAHLRKLVDDGVVERADGHTRRT
ncbi:MAG: MBL fold metallo-hydrolase [Deltaproteobacteria bacterium]|nr:MBL fold metallo-hydrolase [Deltaproteobacteria bacterium]